MRIDPEAVYLEVSEASTVYNSDTGKTRTAPAVIVHWKDGRRWRRRSLIADEGQTLGQLLGLYGNLIDRHGVDVALAGAATDAA